MDLNKDLENVKRKENFKDFINDLKNSLNQTRTVLPINSNF